MRGICKAAQKSLRLAVVWLFGTQFSVYAGTNVIGPMCNTLEEIRSKFQIKICSETVENAQRIYC